MKTTKTLLAGAAFAGIMTGGFLAKANAASTAANGINKANLGIEAFDKKEKGETHDCAGKNSCKGKGGCAVKDGKPVHGK